MLHTRTPVTARRTMEGWGEQRKGSSISMPFKFLFKNEPHVSKILDMTLVVDTYFL